MHKTSVNFDIVMKSSTHVAYKIFFIFLFNLISNSIHSIYIKGTENQRQNEMKTLSQEFY